MRDLLEHFISETRTNFLEVKEEQKELREKIDVILQFKWQVIGGSVVLSVIFTLIYELITK